MTQSDTPPAPPADAGQSRRLERVRRLLGYAGWTFAAAALPLALDRLLIHPVLSRELGDIRFSAMVWVIGLINMVGLVGYNGFAILLMRDYTARPPGEGQRLFRTAMLLTVGTTVAVIAVALALAWPFTPVDVRHESLPLLLGFACFGVVRAVAMIQVTYMRIRRQFRWLFVLRAIEAGVLLINLALASRQSMWLIVVIYTMSVLLPLPVGAYAAREVVGRGRWWSGVQAKWLMTGWIAGAAISLIDQAQVYGARVLLGVLGDNLADVGALYAATAIGVMFVIPVQMLSQLVLSLLGGQTRFALGGKRGWQYLTLTLVFSVLVAGLSYLIGRQLLGVLYPAQAATALGLYHFVALANGFDAVKQMIRPVLLKYAPLAKTVAWSGLTLAVQLTAIFVLVPRYQAEGAAAAMAVSGSIAAVIWVAFYLRVHRRLSAGPSAGSP